MSDQTYSPEMRRIQAGVTLFAMIWEASMGSADILHQEWLFAGVELVTAFICLGLSWYIAQGKIQLNQLGSIAIALVTITFACVLFNDVTEVHSLTVYSYMDATLMVGLAFAFFDVRFGIILAALVNLTLAVGTLLTRSTDLSLVAGEIFISALFVYIALHNRHVLKALNLAAQANNEIADMTSHDQVTGLKTRPGLQVYLRQTWPQIDDFQKGQAAVVAVQVNGFQTITRNLGGEAGNRVLQKVAVHLIQGSDLRDVVARGEGPTFLMFLVNVRRRDVIARMEELSERLNGPLWVSGPRISLNTGFVMLSEVSTPKEGIDLALERCKANSLAAFSPYEGEAR